MTPSLSPDDDEVFGPEALLDRFEEAWQAGTPPHIRDFLAAASDRPQFLEELVKIDLEYRWRSATLDTVPLPHIANDDLPTHPRVEDYLDRFPELGSISEDLIAEEYWVRHRWGDAPGVEEYERRFPSVDSLAILLQAVDEELAAEGKGLRRPERYVRERVHAVGGIGKVWIAHDTAIGRNVALKELRPEAVSHPSLRQRFLAEAQITGRLEHPGIVPVYDLLPATPDRPACYAMRFVRGRTLTEAIQHYHKHRPDGLELRSLLLAFVSVCNAVAYAHSHGVIHRDLKGQNVILGDFGEVQLLDWGLARVRKREGTPYSVLSTPDSGEQPEATVDGAILGTPAYMSPEQAAGRPADERSDIFGLGAILYEILTGKPPFPGKDRAAVLAKARESNPPRPGTLNPVPRALEAICLKAMAHKPNDRYTTASDLAREVQCWLADEPVRAYREPLSAQIARWARKHRTLVTGLVSLLVTAVVALSISTILIAREQAKTREAQERAEANFRRALAVVDRFCTRVSEERLLNEPGLQPLRKELLQDARDFYQEFAQGASSDSRVSLELANASWRLADLTAMVEPGARVEELYRDALHRFESARDRHDQDAILAGWAGVQNNLGNWHRMQGRADLAKDAYERALQERRRLAERSPAYRLDLGRSLNNLGVLHREANRLDDAEPLLAEALTVRRQLVAERAEDQEARLEVAQALGNLASVRRARGDTTGAEEHYREALALAKLGGSKPAFREALAAARNNLGELYRSTKQPSAAETEFNLALAGFEKLAQESPVVTRYQHARARCLTNLGALHEAMGRRLKAEMDYRAAREVLERLIRDYPSVSEFAVDLGGVYLNTAHLVAKGGDNLSSLPWYGKAIETLTPLVSVSQGGPPARGYLWQAHVERALALGQLNRHAEAVRDWDRMLGLDQGKSPRELKFARLSALARSGDHAGAVKEAEEMEAGASGGDLYDLACIHALAVAAVRKDTSLDRAVQDRQAGQHAERAISLLRRAYEAGFLKVRANVHHLDSDPDLDAIRKEPEFERLARILHNLS